MAKQSKKPIGQRNAEAGLWEFFEDAVTDGSLLSFCEHAGIRGMSADRAWDEFQAHFTENGRINMDRFVTSLATWGPIASRVVELQLDARCRG